MNSILDNITHEERRGVQYVQLINGDCVCVKTTRDAKGKEYQYTASYAQSNFTSPREDE